MAAKKLSYLREGLYVGATKKMGRGVFTEEAIPAGTLIELSPVIVMNGKNRVDLDKTLLHDYIFEWGKKLDQCAMALGLVSVYNHSYKANCQYGMYFNQQAISIITVRDIEAGEELFINYNGTWDDEKKVWFDAK
ncbi:SET domain-containing protein [Flavisolibacter nicotianae]|uniref:SET domain-containing protein n=1 Tax=Flavisolibacter nicotianae TaxID=2364882 RepID=UPI000EB20CFF|nr:SET domain-containing protein [Flavisolibacter nicotianae]